MVKFTEPERDLYDDFLEKYADPQRLKNGKRMILAKHLKEKTLKGKQMKALLDYANTCTNMYSMMARVLDVLFVDEVYSDPEAEIAEWDLLPDNVEGPVDKIYQAAQIYGYIPHDERRDLEQINRQQIVNDFADYLGENWEEL